MDSISEVLIQMTRVVDQFSEDQENEALLPQVEDLLHTLTSVNFSDVGQTLKDRTVKILNQIDQEVKTIPKGSTDKIQEIQAKILSFKKELRAPIVPKIDGTLVFICDIDSSDHNGAMLNRVVDLLTYPAPFITSRSLIAGANRCDYSASYPSDSALEILSKNAEDWVAFVSPVNEEMVLFFPRSEISEIKSLGMRADLKQISITEALSGPRGKSNLEGFQSFFNPEPEGSKLIYLAGHGGVGRPGGMDKEHYLEFLSFIEEQGCRGLALTTCYGGGESSLIPLPVEGKDGVSYPIITHSIGDYPTLSGQNVEENIQYRLAVFRSILESSGSSNISRWQKRIRTYEAGRWKPAVNQMQIYFPSSMRSHGGFRPSVEVAGVYPLTIVAMERFRVISNEIVLKDQQQLEVFPTVVDLPIRFEGADPVLMSMTPGKAHHYFEKITLCKQTPLQWLRGIYQVAGEGLGSEKGFFIQSLLSENQELKNVAFFIKAGVCQGFYQKEGQHYYWNGIKEVPITPFQYHSRVQVLIEQTAVSPEALRVATGGRQNEETFKHAIVSADFSNTDLQPETGADKVERVFQLCRTDQKNEALEYINDNKMPLDSVDCTGCSFPFIAVKQGNHEMVKLLLAQGVDFNRLDPVSGYYPIHLAVQEGEQAIVELLLSVENIELNVKVDDVGGRTVPQLAYDKPKILALLHHKGADVNIPSLTGRTPLASACIRNKVDSIRMLLDLGADPMAGDPSAIFFALRFGNIDAINIILEQGIELIAEDKKKVSPLVQAVLVGTPAIIDTFLRHVRTDINVAEGLFNSVLPAAICRGNYEIIKKVVDAGARFPSRFDKGFVYDRIKMELSLMCESKDIEIFLEILFSSGVNRPKEFDALLFDSLLKKRADIVLSLLKDKRVSPGIELGDGGTLLGKACPYAINDFTKYREIFEEAFSLGFTLKDKIVGNRTLTEYAEFKESIELIDWLIEKRVSPKEFLDLFVKLGDLDHVKGAIGDDEKVAQRFLMTALLNLKNDPSHEVIKFLIKQRGNPETFDKNGIHPMYYVAQTGDIDFVKYYLDKCSRLEQPLDINRAFVGALMSGNIEMVTLFEEQGFVLENEYITKPVRAFLFTEGYLSGGIEMLKRVMNVGVDVGALKSQDKREFWEAVAERNDEETVLLLKDNMKLIQSESFANAVIRHGRVNLLKIFIEAGHPLNLESFNSVLKTGNLEIIELFLKNGANPNGYSFNHSLFDLIKSGNLDTVKLLCKYGADYTQTSVDELESSSGMTPTEWAKYLEQVEIYNYLMGL